MGKPVVVVPEPTPFEALAGGVKDAVLFSGDFGWMFYAALIAFCACSAGAVLKASPKINFFHGCALMVLSSFGGSTLAAIMVGAPVVFVANEALVTVCLAVWTAAYVLPTVLLGILGSPIGRLVAGTGYEIMRCHVLMNCSKMASTTLTGVVAGGRVPVIGPLIAGTLGGCGGGFMPLNKGLDPLANGTNWRIASGAINAVWILMSTQYPSTKEAIGLSVDMAKFVAVSFFVLVPLFQTFTGIVLLGANPLVPDATPAKKKKA